VRPEQAPYADVVAARHHQLLPRARHRQTLFPCNGVTFMVCNDVCVPLIN
jgi:hypothetical protein